MSESTSQEVMLENSRARSFQGYEVTSGCLLGQECFGFLVHGNSR